MRIEFDGGREETGLLLGKINGRKFGRNAWKELGIRLFDIAQREWFLIYSSSRRNSEEDNLVRGTGKENLVVILSNCPAAMLKRIKDKD